MKTKITMAIDEKKLIYVYGCKSYKATAERLGMLAALTVSNDMKKKVNALHNRIAKEITEKEYIILYPMICSQMRLYADAEHIRKWVEDADADMFEHIGKR